MVLLQRMVQRIIRFLDNPIPVKKVTDWEIINKLYSLNRIYKKSLTQVEYSLLVASKMGELKAGVYAASEKKPIILKLYEFLINV